MNGCTTCGGFGNRHDPIAHDAEPPEVESPAMSAEDLIEDLITHLQARRSIALRALRASTNAGADYWRWNGHAELSRQLLERLGADVPQ